MKPPPDCLRVTVWAAWVIDVRRHDLTPFNEARRLSATVAHPIAHRL